MLHRARDRGYHLEDPLHRFACGVLALAILGGCAQEEERCLCLGEVPGGLLDVACGETQCLGGTLYRCTGPNLAVADGTCAAPNLRAEGSPDFAIFSVSGHCFGLSCPDINPKKGLS